MSLNIGTLVGYLQLDDANFERKADAADRKINALKLHLEALGRENPKIGVEVTTQTAQLDELKLKLAALKEQAASGADVRVDAVQALIELDRVQTKIRELHGKTIDVKVDVDKSKIDSAATAIDGFLGGIGMIPTLAIAGTSALIPLVGVVGALALALGAPLALAAGGLTVFGFLGSLAAKDTEAKLKQIDKLQLQLGTMTKGTAAYAQQLKLLRSAQADLTPEQTKFATAQDRVKAAFQTFLQGAGGKTLLDVMAQGMTVLAHLLPVISPVIAAVGHALSTILDGVDKAARGQGLHNIIGELSRLMGTDILASAHILGNLAGGLGALFLVLARSHVSHDVLQGVVDLTGSFDKWANSKAARHDVRDLFDYFQKVGPGVANTLGKIASAIGHIIKALAPLGPPLVKIIGNLAGDLSSIPVPVLTGLASAFLAMKTFQMAGGFKLIGALNKVHGTSLLGGILGGKNGGTGGIAGSVLGGVQKVYVVNMGPGGLGGGPIEGEGKLFGRFALSELLAGASQFGLLAAAAYFDYRATKTIVHQVATSESKYAFGQALPTNGGPVGPKTSAAAQRQQSQLFWMDGGGQASLHSTATAIDALKQHATDASRQIDLIGPHASAAFGAASHDVDTFRSKLAAIQDKHLAVILQDQAAIQSLEALQRLRLADKTMTVTTIYQQRERTVGPGGGIGHHALGGFIFGPGSGTSDSIPSMLSNGEFVVRQAQAAANAPLLQAINNGSGRVSLASAGGARGGYHSAAMPSRFALTITNWDEGTGHIEAIASDVNAADHRYATAVGRN